MKNLYLTTAIILSLGGAAVSQTATTEAPAPAATPAAPAADAVATTPAEAAKTGLFRASALEGVDVYTVDLTGTTTWDDGTRYTEIDADWDKIGEIEDLVLDTDGNIVGAIAEVGGFLGIGEKEVVLNPDEITFVMTADRIGVVSALSKEALEQREAAAEDIRKGD